ncbi:MAG: endolytic transglycosylase MltG, partial [Anaerolineae bacterium]
IAAGESALAVAERLAALNLVSDAQLFRQFLRYNQLDVSIEAGDYTLRRNMNMKDIGAALQKASFKEVVVTIPEGWRAEQIAEMLTGEEIMDGSEFLAVVREGAAVEHNLLFDRPEGQSYEGYLFPDTYRLPVNATPADLIERMLDNLAAKLPANTFDLAGRQNLSLYQVLTIASIVEREAVIAAERPTIASVYLNRIAQNMYLQADPTVQYAMGYQPESDQWWKTPVTLEEYSAINSPYNTYLNPGLPPGPIANPGIDSIVAVLEPADTNYLFFVAYGDGAHVFAETFEEHQSNVKIYQGQ